MNPSRYWADIVTHEILDTRGDSHVISSGTSPSGVYHIGSLREVLTADMIANVIKESGGEAAHVHVVDDFDPLRKIPAGVGKRFEKYLGTPYFLIPDPSSRKCHRSWSEHFFDDFYQAVDQLGIKLKVVRSNDLYRAGKFAKSISDSLARLERIKEIIRTVTGRELESGWTPLEVLCDKCGKINQSRVVNYDLAGKTVEYVCACGGGGSAAFDSGKIKLNWRLDWPARWRLLAVTVEPFGKDHAAAGGSYDSGKQLSQEVFGYPPPYPIPYEFVQLKGFGKLSKSSGGGVGALETLAIIPPEILRYWMLRGKPGKHLDLDLGRGLYNLIEEYSQVETASAKESGHEFSRAFNLTTSKSGERVISEVPFAHLVMTYQTAQGVRPEVNGILERTGYGQAVKREEKVIARELGYIERWLAAYAPDDIKFSVKKTLPKELKLTAGQRKFISALADQLPIKPDGQEIHDAIYRAATESKLTPKEAFQVIYLVFLGQDFGPRAGWFLSSLPRNFVTGRLKEAAAE